MTTPYLADMLIAERTRELHREAANARLAALVRCCRPSTWARAAQRARAAAARLRPARSTAAACCTA
jgi:hypothetical protein